MTDMSALDRPKEELGVKVRSRKRRLAGVSLAAVAVLGAAGAAGIVVADNPMAAAANSGQAGGAPAADSETCHHQEWSDSTTFGAACQEGYAYKYQAKALCKNGQFVYGPMVAAPAWSYAYCSQVGSTLDHGVISLRVS